jgi:hypothetical protein
LLISNNAEFEYFSFDIYIAAPCGRSGIKNTLKNILCSTAYEHRNSGLHLHHFLSANNELKLSVNTLHSPDYSTRRKSSPGCFCASCQKSGFILDEPKSILMKRLGLFVSNSNGPGIECNIACCDDRQPANSHGYH